jgi:hypothetical protein
VAELRNPVLVTVTVVPEMTSESELVKFPESVKYPVLITSNTDGVNVLPIVMPLARTTTVFSTCAVAVKTTEEVLVMVVDVFA